MSLISVAIVEDDDHFRSVFVEAVEGAPDMRVAGVAVDVPGGLHLLDTVKPDVLLVDLGLSDGSGLTLIRHAVAHLPGSDVLVVTIFGDEQHVVSSIAAGATGYLLKDSQTTDIAHQIRTLRAGGSPISPVIARQLLSRMAPTFQVPPTAAQAPPERAAAPVSQDLQLSVQECKVLSLSSKGYAYEEIAQLMGLSSNTVMTYVKRSYRKLQVHSKTEAVYEAKRLGWVDD